jgi:hypothetical protein
MKKILLALIVGLVGLTACGSAGSLGTVPTSPAGTTSPSPSTDPTTKSPTPKRTTPSPKKPSPAPMVTSCETVKGGSDDPSNVSGAQLVDVRVGSHDTYDRVTFEFSGQATVPPFRIRTVTTPTEDGSGKPLSLSGSSYAEIVFQHASGYDLYYHPTYDGPKDFRPGYPFLAEVREAGDFERVLTWAFGLNGPACWHVTQLDDPVRLAVDFSH